MNRRTISEAIVFMFLVGVGVMTRVLMRDIPNFAPVAALALFAGYMFRHQLVACAVPLLVMLVSDLIIDAGGYPLPLMLAVYGLLAFPVCLRGTLRRFLSLENHNLRTRRLWTSFGGLIGCSLACSLLFFVGTNWMVCTR